MSKTNSISETRATYSAMRLSQLRKGLEKLPELSAFDSLTIFGAGSYARLEASEFSDIDMFFLTSAGEEDIPEPRTRSLRIFGKVISLIDEMSFPKFSNDCEYLVLLHTKDILKTLGSRDDDYENYFTARMLLLLESQCLFGQKVYDEITAAIVASYFKDYPDHRETFQPVFLLNDICRFWKTLLLNYENRRHLVPADEDYEAKKTRHKVKNFKLKYSRMTTCFASIASLGSHRAPVKERDVLELIRLTPRQRLESIPTRMPELKPLVDEVLERYSWFLEMTGLSTSKLEDHFSDKKKREEMFGKASDYGDSMYKLLRGIDAAEPKLKLLRYLVV